MISLVFIYTRHGGTLDMMDIPSVNGVCVK